MKKAIQARLKELKAARDAYVVEANATVQAYNTVIGELEQILTTVARPARSAPQEAPPTSDSPDPHR